MSGRILARAVAALNALIWAFLCLRRLSALRELGGMNPLVLEDFGAIGFYSAGLATAVALAVAVFVFRKTGVAIFAGLLALLALFFWIVENASRGG